LPAEAESGSGGAEWGSWNVESEHTPTTRHQVYRSVFSLLLHAGHDQRQRAADRLLEWAGVEPAPRPTHRPLTADEVVQLGSGSLVEIGAHTVNHPVLSTLAESEQAQEIEASRRQLEGLLGRAVTSFAYPYGTRADYTDGTVAAVRRSGFTRACSNFSGLVLRRTDRWQLPRILVRNWSGDELTRRMGEWLN
jgi:peptidoglycan/xylan/chitin deacetylase (PgdA/CDA1 family)